MLACFVNIQAGVKREQGEGGGRDIQCGSKRYFPSVPCRRRLLKSRVYKVKSSKEGRGVAERSGGLANFIRGMERVLGARGEEQRMDW